MDDLSSVRDHTVLSVVAGHRDRLLAVRRGEVVRARLDGLAHVNYRSHG